MNIQQNMASSGGGGNTSGGGSGVLGGLAGAGLSAILGIGQGRKQYHRNKKLMRFQKQHQMDLSQFGHDLQMDMWNKTNYKAQLEHMRAAGLNPALMYGQAGQGGTTGSQGGGSAQSGSVDQARVMDLSNALIGAQITSLEAKANKDNADADATTGYKGDESRQNVVESGQRIDESVQRILESKENIKNLGEARNEMRSRIVLNAADADLKRSGIELNAAQMDQIDKMIEKIDVDVKLQKKILELDYGDNVGRNWMANAYKLFSGEFDTGTYIGAAATIAGLAILKNPTVLGTMFRSTTKVKGFNADRTKGVLQKVYDGAKEWFKNKFKN